MCGRLVNLDTVARVLADYYHLKTGTQLAALDEALSKVPAVSVGGGHKKDHVADPGKMVGDLMSSLIERQAAIDALAEWHDEAITNRLNNLPSAQRWIPCTPETMPPDYQWYYATCKSLVDNRENWVVEGCYTPWEHFDSTPMIKCGKAVVIAWMPKEYPEPWKGEET